MFVDIPGKNYKVLDTHVTYGLVEAIKLAAKQICPDSLDKLNKITSFNEYEDTPSNLPSKQLLLRTPVVNKSFIDFCSLSNLFSDVYSIWCNQKVTVRPMTLSEHIYCSYRNESDPNYYDIPDDGESTSFLTAEIKKCREYCSPKDLASKTINGQDYETVFDNFPLVKQREPSWCGLYDTFGHTHTMTFIKRADFVNMKKNNYTTRSITLVGGSSITNEEKTWAANALTRIPNQTWTSVGTRFLLEESDSNDI